MTTPQTDPAEPQRRAAEAAEALAAEGKAVTSRTVRERAGVKMAVATEAAREWNDRAAEQVTSPDVPDTVLARFTGIWREAYTAARDHFAAERDGLIAKVRASDKEVASLAEDLTGSDVRIGELEAELETVRVAAEDTARTAAAEHTHALSEARSRADRAEGALQAVTAERDRLLGQIAAATRAGPQRPVR